MRNMRTAGWRRWMAAGLMLGAAAVPAWAKTPKTTPTVVDGLEVVRPETQGFSTERLENLHRLIQEQVDQKKLAGAVTLLARHGKVVDFRAYGVRDLSTGAPMTTDTIFRDYSMTKPVTGVAMMILYEEGKWLPLDSIVKYIPEFAHLKVFAGFDQNGKMILEEPRHAPTMEELMTHTAGFSYGFSDSPVDKMYRAMATEKITTPEEGIKALAKIPLNYQPGTEWMYSVSMDIEGDILQQITGQSLPDFMREHIFTPLGMKDAGFYVPADKRSRFASNYGADEQDHLIPMQPVRSAPTDDATEPKMASGGGGLVSTAADYFRFAQMLANGGELDGHRILSPETVRLMTTNHLPAQLLTGRYGIGAHIMRPGFGYGFNCAVAYDPQEAGLPDGKGTFLWDGAAGTWFWVDPANDVVFVAMIQRMGGDNHELEYKSHAVVYGALVQP